MELRLARKGSNAGGLFWGCTGFPACRGTRNAGGGPEPGEPNRPARRPGLLPVEWTEGVTRDGFVPEYASVGAIPGIFHDRLSCDARLTQVLSQCVLLSNRGRERHAPSDDSRFASALLLKILRRGRTPLPTLRVERVALRARGLLDRVTELGADGPEVGWRHRPEAPLRTDPESVLSLAIRRVPFTLDRELGSPPGSDHSLLQGRAERRFLNEWVPKALGPSAGHWFTPQAPLDILVRSGGSSGARGPRRVDFLFSHPGGPPFAIEIDGPEHAAAARVDAERDESLRSVGIEVIRLTNDELLHGRGNALEQILARCRKAFAGLPPHSGDSNLAALVTLDCAIAAKVQFAVARAVECGWLAADGDWKIEIGGAGRPAAAGLRDALDLLAGFDALYGVRSVPATCTVRLEERQAVTWKRTNGGKWARTSAPQCPGQRVRIAVEPWASPFHEPPAAGHPDFLVRPAFVPALLATRQSFDIASRPASATTYPAASSPLRLFLRHVFRKREFRPMQGEAVLNALRHEDCVVLLPTGGGKSIIYQLAGLLMPGLTLVVDPINALIDDQVDGLRAYGIDRAVPITGAIDHKERERLLELVEHGEYQFVLHSPERLQSPRFRSALRVLAGHSLVNLAVIDEAHCVSEWGHDFRPAYLNLAGNLRRLGARGGKSPPLLALTGTASRAVLRDVLAELGIDQRRSGALIRPESFDRPEIRFEIVRTSPSEDPQAALRGVLNALPGKLRLPPQEFFRPVGTNTASGIVFVPTVRDRTYGLLGVRNIVHRVTAQDTTVYSGTPPLGDAADWNDKKRANAAAFKANRVAVLVATKAYGMGIDKPNVRYTVHFGMPMSLESFYQEAGRAGRDGKPARSTVVFSEYDSSRSDWLIDPDLGLDELRERFEALGPDRHSGDDVTRALWFHLEAFKGARQEIGEAEEVIDLIGNLSSSRPVWLPRGDEGSGKRRERAIYRLLKIGVIRDYEVDFGSKRFVIHARRFDFDECRNRLLDCVRAAKPGKHRWFVEQADAIGSAEPREAVLALVKMLIEFTYDEIERSRRRTILESVLLARQARSDSEIRRRLLNYLQEGFGSERIEQLVASERVALSAWWELVGKLQTGMDADELRGLCIRALESDPDHPGLLLTRAIAEAMCSDHDVRVSAKGIGAALGNGVKTYGISRGDIESAVDEMFDLAASRARDLGPPLAMALLDLADSHPGRAFLEPAVSRRAPGLGDPRVRAIVATRRIRALVARLERTAAGMLHRYEMPGISKALGGATWT